MASRSQIVATLGPASSTRETFLSMAVSGADVARIHFSSSDHKEMKRQIDIIRDAERKLGKKIPIIADLPGPHAHHRGDHGHKIGNPLLSHEDMEHVRFCIKEKVDYFALSFVGSDIDILQAKKDIKFLGGHQKVIAKIERRAAIFFLDKIIDASDGIMIARGDLGTEVPLEDIPYIQDEIVQKTKKAGKPVIVATQMMLSMTKSAMPTRAEVTDVSNAILKGADAVMLSEETARGRHPVEAVAMMERIIAEAERHLPPKTRIHTF